MWAIPFDVWNDFDPWLAAFLLLSLRLSLLSLSTTLFLSLFALMEICLTLGVVITIARLQRRESEKSFLNERIRAHINVMSENV